MPAENSKTVSTATNALTAPTPLARRLASRACKRHEPNIQQGATSTQNPQQGSTTEQRAQQHNHYQGYLALKIQSLAK